MAVSAVLRLTVDLFLEQTLDTRLVFITEASKLVKVYFMVPSVRRNVRLSALNSVLNSKTHTTRPTQNGTLTTSFHQTFI